MASKEEKIIRRAVQNFDEENHEFRFKHFDVEEYNGDYFVEYVSQEDEWVGGEKLGKLLNSLSKKLKVKIYLYYIIRDDHKAENNIRTKKGYTNVDCLGDKMSYAEGGGIAEPFIEVSLFNTHNERTPQMSYGSFASKLESLEEVVEKAQRIMKDKNYVYGEIYSLPDLKNQDKFDFLGSISSKSDYKFQYGRGFNKNPLKTTYAEGGEINLPNGVFIDTTKTTQSKDEILEMYSNQGYTAIGGGSLLSDNFKKYNRDKDIYIIVGEINRLDGIPTIYMGKNEVAVQNFIPKNLDAKVITKISNTDSGSTYAKGGGVKTKEQYEKELERLKKDLWDAKQPKAEILIAKRIKDIKGLLNTKYGSTYAEGGKISSKANGGWGINLKWW